MISDAQTPRFADLSPGVEHVAWAAPFDYRPAPDLSGFLAARHYGRPWLLELWEPIPTKAPSPSRCQPFCCYVRTVIFYHRPYINRGGKPWFNGRRWQWISAPAGFVQFDQVDTHLSWDDIVRFDGDEFVIGGGTVRWHRKRWWMQRQARRREQVALRSVA